MADAERFDLLMRDPQPVFDWLAEHAPGAVVRRIAYETVLGWHVKVVLDAPDARAAFRERWHRNFAGTARTRPDPDEETP